MHVSRYLQPTRPLPGPALPAGQTGPVQLPAAGGGRGGGGSGVSVRPAGAVTAATGLTPAQILSPPPPPPPPLAGQGPAEPPRRAMTTTGRHRTAQRAGPVETDRCRRHWPAASQLQLFLNDRPVIERRHGCQPGAEAAEPAWWWQNRRDAGHRSGTAASVRRRSRPQTGVTLPRPAGWS